MSATALPLAPPTLSSPTRTVRIFAREVRYEFVRAVRNKAFAFSAVGFPTMFYVLFGVMNKAQIAHGQNIAKHMLASYASFGIVGAALFGIGLGLSVERNSGWLELKRASPMPPLAYLLAKCAMATAFAMVIVSVLSAIAIGFADVHLSLSEYLRMLAVTLGGAVPFSGMGLLLAMLIPANAAPGIVNMIYLPMSYFSGLWIPIWALPKWVQHIAPALPTYHMSQIMLGVFGYAQPGSSAALHWLALGGYACVFFGLAALAFARKEGEP